MKIEDKQKIKKSEDLDKVGVTDLTKEFQAVVESIQICNSVLEVTRHSKGEVVIMALDLYNDLVKEINKKTEKLNK